MKFRSWQLLLILISCVTICLSVVRIIMIQNTQITEIIEAKDNRLNYEEIALDDSTVTRNEATEETPYQPIIKRSELEYNLIINSTKLNINTATVEELASIAAIGQENAEKVIAFRTKQGPFSSVADIDKVFPITPTAMRELSSLLFAGRSGEPSRVEVTEKKETIPEQTEKSTLKETAATTFSGKKININTADIDALCELPRVGPKTAERIIQHRTEKGKFKKIEDIMDVKGIGQKTFDNFKDMIVVSEE